MFPSWIYLFVLFLKNSMCVSQITTCAEHVIFSKHKLSVCVKAHVLLISPFSSVYSGLTGSRVQLTCSWHHHCQQGPETDKINECCQLAVAAVIKQTRVSPSSQKPNSNPSSLAKRKDWRETTVRPQLGFTVTRGDYIRTLCRKLGKPHLAVNIQLGCGLEPKDTLWKWHVSQSVTVP